MPFNVSNKVHQKMSPFVVNYFIAERGIERPVIELVNETADHIAVSLRKVLQMNNINIQKMTPTRVDNMNANYGRIHSGFSLLKPDVPNLIKGVSLSKKKKYQVVQKARTAHA